VRISLGIAAGAVIAATLPLTGGRAHAAPATVRPMTSGWSIGQINSLPGEDEIKAISVAPTGSAWSVGYQTVDGASVPLVQHLLNGTWTTAKAPAGDLGEISTLDASSSKNVWVFGTPDDGSYATRWNGTSWTRTTLSSGYYFATAAEALSATDVWAVGGDRTKTAKHWTGSGWTDVALPVPARAIAGVSGTHVYAGGTNGHQPAVMHWTGSAWTLARTPRLALPDPAAVGVVNDVYARSASDVWAAGGFAWGCGDSGDDVCTQPLLLHWDGAAWSSMLFARGESSSFTQVTGDDSGGIWLLEGGWNPKLVDVSGDFVSTVEAPRPAGHDIHLTTLAVQGTTVWAGGVEFPQGDPPDPTGNGLYLRTG
jgi:hypothetical protein